MPSIIAATTIKDESIARDQCTATSPVVTYCTMPGQELATATRASTAIDQRRVPRESRRSSKPVTPRPAIARRWNSAATRSEISAEHTTSADSVPSSEAFKHADRMLIELSIDDRAGADGGLIRSLEHLQGISGQPLERLIHERPLVS